MTAWTPDQFRMAGGLNEEDPAFTQPAGSLAYCANYEVLAGGGPSDVVALTLRLAAEMLAAAGVDHVDPADRLADGSAMDAWRRMIAAQGGDPSAALPTARESHVVVAPASGVLSRLDAYAVGVAAWRLGAGRARKEDPVSAGAGVVMHAKPGDEVRVGAPLLTLYADDAARFERALAVQPHQAQAHYRRGQVLRDLGRAGEALDAQAGAGQRHDVGAVEPDLAADRRTARQQPVDRPRRHRLA